MSALLSPNPVLRFYGSDGQPLSGGYLQTLDSETSNPVATYRDAGMTTENPSTIMLDANGEPSDNGVPVGVFLVPDAVYKFKWFDSDMSLVGSSDGIVAGGGSGSGTGLVEVIGTAEHINVTHSVVRGVSVYRVDLAPSLVSEIDSLDESVVQLGNEMDALEGIVASKADKVQGATAGNLAALDANGNLTDSGKKAADFATDSQGDKADSAVQGVNVNGTELSKDGNNKVDVPVPTASTDTPLKDGTASAGSSTQWARGDHRHPTDDSREAVANKVQSIDDESTTEYPSSKAVADFVNSSVATNTANFLGSFSLTDLGLTYPATYVQIAAALNNHTWPTGVTPTNNDYVYIEIANPSTPAINDKVERFKYSDALASWGYEYTLNNSSFTAAEIAAIDSGITATDKGNYDAHLLDTSNPHNVTKPQVGLGNVVNTGDSATPEQGGTEKFTTGGAYTELAKKLDKNGDGTDVTTTPTTEADYTKPTAATKLSVLFGKLWYFVSRLRTSIRATSSASDTEFPSEKAVATALAGLVSQNGIARSDGAVIAPFMYNNTDTTILGYPGYQVWFRIELSGRKTYLATITIKATTNTKSVQVAIDTLEVEESNVLVNDVAIRYVAGEQDLLEYAGNDNPNNINNIKFFKCKDSGGTHYLAIKCGYAVPNESMNAAVSVICYDYTQSTTPIQRNTYNTNTWPDWCTNWEQRFAIIDAENTPTFSEAASRVNLVGSDETMPTILGKIKKWFADLKSVAWSGSYDDLTNKPSLATVATSGSYSDLSNKPTIPTVDQTYNATSTNPQSGTAVAQALVSCDNYHGNKGWFRILHIDLSQFNDAILYIGYVAVFDLFSDNYQSGRAYLGRLVLEVSNYGTLNNKTFSKNELYWAFKASINDTTFRPNLVVSQGHVEVYLYHSVNGDYYTSVRKVYDMASWLPSNILFNTTFNSQYYNDSDYSTYIAAKTVTVPTVAHMAIDNSTYAARVGSEGRHPKIGDTSIPVYVDADGQVQPCGFQVNFGSTLIAGPNVLNIAN